ncbi:GLPGLI family protein [Bizionia sediminis]|uniref:GLPGLI family protein n=1 Tax=Bizionia sediminis TaxID=1737064 RepID=A0ABW5KTU2_9FLAO
MKNLYIVVFLLGCFCSNAQNTYGEIFYNFNLNFNYCIDNYEYKATLVFNDFTSVFNYNSSKLEGEYQVDLTCGHLHNENHTTITRYVFEDDGQKTYYNKTTNKLYSQQLLEYNYLIWVQDDGIDFNWKITNETKKIGTYLAYKAQTNFRGRLYNAWFTYGIPLSYGPWKFHGLPGLILEIKDEFNQIHITANTIKITKNSSDQIAWPEVKEALGIEEFLNQKYLLYQDKIETQKAVLANKGSGFSKRFKPQPYYSIEFLDSQIELLQAIIYQVE